MFAALLGVCTACGQSKQDETTYKYTIYCGLNDAANGGYLMDEEPSAYQFLE